MPSTGLAAASWGAPLACVKWLFTRTVHFILHRLEALGGAGITQGCMFKGNPNHFQLGIAWLAERKPREEAIGQLSVVLGLFQALVQFSESLDAEQSPGLSCSKCLGLIFIVTQVAAAATSCVFFFFSLRNW